MKFNFDKFVKANKDKKTTDRTPEETANANAQKDSYETRRRWLLQFREKWQNRIKYTRR